MAAPARRLSDQEIRSLLLQARTRGQSRTFNDVLSYWGESVGWQGYEADIARARGIFADGPEAWTRSEPVAALSEPAAPVKNEASRPPRTEPPQIRPAPVEPSSAPVSRETISAAPSESAAPARATAESPRTQVEQMPSEIRPDGIPTSVWILLLALGLGIVAVILYRLLRSR